MICIFLFTTLEFLIKFLSPINFINTKYEGESKLFRTGILAINSEKLLSFFMGGFQKLFVWVWCIQPMWVMAEWTNFFDNFTLKLDSRVKIIAILWCISLGYLKVHPKNCLSKCSKFIYNKFKCKTNSKGFKLNT